MVNVSLSQFLPIGTLLWFLPFRGLCDSGWDRRVWDTISKALSALECWNIHFKYQYPFSYLPKVCHGFFLLLPLALPISQGKGYMMNVVMRVLEGWWYTYPETVHVQYMRFPVLLFSRTSVSPSVLCSVLVSAHAHFYKELQILWTLGPGCQ